MFECQLKPLMLDEASRFWLLCLRGDNITSDIQLLIEEIYSFIDLDRNRK